MSGTNKRKKSILEIGPPDKPYAKLFFTEKRIGSRDRRKLNTFIADDRRSGIADRRKHKNKRSS